MKVKILSRNPDDYLRETKHDIHKVQRNYDPALHPFEVSREYVRALNAVKLERVFAKPYLGDLDGHRDFVQCMMKHPTSLSNLFSGSCDGEIRLWNLAERKCVQAIQAHDGAVRGMCMPLSGSHIISVGDDKVIKQWNLQSSIIDEPVNTILSKSVLADITHHRKEPLYATCGEQVDIWEETRSEPIRSLSWGTDTIKTVRFNPIETNLLGGTANDRSIILYDVREACPLRKVILEMCCNAISWNPMEAFVFTAACEDYNLYTFDIRKLKVPLHVHLNHISAVLDVDYSPTGKEFVSGSYDKTLRIFSVHSGKSRDVYHTKRMGRLTCIQWSLDNKYILSGSSDMVIRMWKANASEKLGVLSYREKAALQYNNKLKEKFGHHPQVRRIAQHRHVPKHVYNGVKEIRTIRESRKRKEANRRAHSKPGTVPYSSERTKHIVQEDE